MFGIMISDVQSFSKACLYGSFITNMKHIEDSARVGRNGCITAVAQSHQVISSIAFTNMALNAAQMDSCSLLWGIGGVLTACGITYLSRSGLKNNTVRKIVLFIHDNIGNACQLVALISSIALISLNHLVAGYTSLFFISVGYLNRWGFLPLPIRNFIDTSSPMIQAIAGAWTGEIFPIIISVLNVAFLLFKICQRVILFCSEEPTENEIENLQNESQRFTLTTNSIQEFQNTAYGWTWRALESKYEVGQGHIHRSITVPTPEGSVDEFINLVEELDFRSQIDLIKNTLRNDEQFTDYNGSPDNYSDEELIKKVRENLRLYIHSVKNRYSEAGEIHDYDRLTHYLLCILDALKNKVPEDRKLEAQTTCLIRLAVEGGAYCGPGKFHVAEDLYTRLVFGNSNENMSFETKLLFTLQDLRTQIANSLYSQILAEIKNIPVFSITCDPNDIHVYNQVMNLYFSDFGIRKGAADNDQIAVVDPISKAMLSKISPLIDITKQSYEIDTILDYLQDAIGQELIPKTDFYNYWQNRISNHAEFRQEQKETFLNELENGILFGKPIENELGKINKNQIALTLLDLGILVSKENLDLLSAG